MEKLSHIPATHSPCKVEAINVCKNLHAECCVVILDLATNTDITGIASTTGYRSLDSKVAV